MFKKKDKFKLYYIIKINCDCGNHKEARVNLPKAAWGGLRCWDCYKVVGLLDWEIVDRVKARGDIEAFEIYATKEKERKRDINEIQNNSKRFDGLFFL